tara:strand:+ start:621 stop:1322 length:702 start_codon:yes stop_codon:yes gene_type:complete
MSKIKEYNFFLIFGLNNIKFEVLNSKNEIIFTKNDIIFDSKNNDIYKIVENFLKKNIFEIEKTLNHYVKNIFLVIDYYNFLTVNLSMKYNFNRMKFDQNRLNSSLIELKNQFQNSIGDFKIIHMIINKFLIDSKEYSNLSEQIIYNNLCLEIRFICMNRNIIQNLKNILSKYQIQVNDIICLEYLKEFENFSDRKISIIAQNALNGSNENEIFFRQKSTKIPSFFEKFFNFFR